MIDTQHDDQRHGERGAEQPPALLEESEPRQRTEADHEGQRRQQRRRAQMLAPPSDNAREIEHTVDRLAHDAQHRALGAERHQEDRDHRGGHHDEADERQRREIAEHAEP